jgi:nicotinate-nucleotide adenylyltransferase
LIGFLGGTFDPIHNGHLHAAAAAAAALDLERVHLVLAARPQHRAPPAASIEQRWAMLELAAQDSHLLRADDREMRRATPSYTVDTLEAWRAEHGARAAVVWLLGWDAYRRLPSWYRWRSLLSLAHLAVLKRPESDATLDDEMRQFTVAHRVTEPAPLHRTPCGHVIFIDVPMLPISSTDIRARLRRAEDVGRLLPPRVWTYIRAHHMYAGSPSG